MFCYPYVSCPVYLPFLARQPEKLFTPLHSLAGRKSAMMAISLLSSRATDIQENRQPEMLRDTIPCIVLASLSVIGRFASRRIRRAGFGADDYMIVVALILTWGDFALVVIDTYLGVGKHTELEPPEYVTRHSKVTFACSILYATAITTIKLAILLLYQRIFSTTKFILITRVVGLFVVAWWPVVVIIQVFSCHPVNGFWDRSVPSTCINPAHFYVAVAVPNILTDIIILALPVRMVWRLQMSVFQRIGLSMTFLTGAFVIAASGYRIYWLQQASPTDPLWTYAGIVIWTSIEPSVGIICACLPTLRPLFRDVAGKGHQWAKTTHSFRIRSRDHHGTQLESGYQTAQRAKSSTQGRWFDDDCGLQPKSNISSETAVTSSVLGQDPERDKIPLAGINVQKDVQIDRT